MKQHGMSISHTLFLETVSEEIKQHQPDKLYHEYEGVNVITNPEKINFKDKCLVFDPKKLTDINYSPGAHKCEPEGEIRYYDYQSKNPIKTIHIKNLSLDYKLSRIKMYRERLSQENIDHGMGFQYTWNDEKLTEIFNDDLRQSKPYSQIFARNR